MNTMIEYWNDDGPQALPGDLQEQLSQLLIVTDPDVRTDAEIRNRACDAAMRLSQAIGVRAGQRRVSLTGIPPAIREHFLLEMKHHNPNVSCDA